MADIPDWRSVLGPGFVFTAEEIVRMDELARKRPEMINLLCQRMRAVTDKLVSEFQAEIFGEKS